MLSSLTTAADALAMAVAASVRTARSAGADRATVAVALVSPELARRAGGRLWLPGRPSCGDDAVDLSGGGDGATLSKTDEVIAAAPLTSRYATAAFRFGAREHGRSRY
jgi:hypothetical protein